MGRFVCGRAVDDHLALLPISGGGWPISNSTETDIRFETARRAFTALLSSTTVFGAVVLRLLE
jgi:hypothetical protein